MTMRVEIAQEVLTFLRLLFKGIHNIVNKVVLFARDIHEGFFGSGSRFPDLK